MSPRKPFAEVFLISLAVILLEINYTRVFSFKLVYYFTYVLIGIALLGLGAGGVILATSERLGRLSPGRLLPVCCLVSAAAVALGYLAVALVPLNLFQMISSLGHDPGTTLREGMKLVAVCLILFVPFFGAGVALASVFSTFVADINRLYFADLLGAGLGCAVCVPLMTAISPPGGIMVAGLCLAAAALLSDRGRGGPRRWGAVAIVLLLSAGAALPGRLPDPIPDRLKTRPLAPAFSRWSPVFRVDVVSSGDPNAMFLVHDGTIGSAIRRYSGDPKSLRGDFETSGRSHPFRLLAPAPRVAIIGAAGGHEILASLYFGARHITAVELNPVTVDILTTHFADYTGRLAEHPRVDLVNAEGRSFLAASDEQYDLIWLVAPDSYAAMNAATSGAFVLAESYLYTAEMVEEALAHLGPRGILCAQFGENNFDVAPKRTARYLATARAAFATMGIADFERHVLVGTASGFGSLLSATVLLSKAPFDADAIARFLDNVGRIKDGKVRFAPGGHGEPGPITSVVSAHGPALEAWFAGFPFEVRPVRDDSPFFWHFVSFRDVARRAIAWQGLDLEEGMGERLLLALLVVLGVLAGLLLLLPLVARRAIWSAVPHKLAAGTYFAALGLGFMFLEVCLIQRLTLFLGYPTYALTVTLFALLISTGAGSLASARLAMSRRRALVCIALCLVALVLVTRWTLTPLMRGGIGWPFPLRIATAIAYLLPLGLCLGTFMPLGLRTVSSLTPHGAEYVAWAWAVNGFFSVLSSVLATVLSMSIGFDALLMVGLGVYLVGIVTLWAIPEPGVALAEVEASASAAPAPRASMSS